MKLLILSLAVIAVCTAAPSYRRRRHRDSGYDYRKHSNKPPGYGWGTILSTIVSDVQSETAGIAKSRTYENVLYTINDNDGNQNAIYATDTVTGALMATITVEGAVNGDWEDLSIGPCKGGYYGDCLYIGDIGSSEQRNVIYMVKEPDVKQGDQTVMIFKELSYMCKDYECPDIETMLVDPKGEVYLVTSVANEYPKATKVPSYGWNKGSPVTLRKWVRLAIKSDDDEEIPTGGSLSPDGKRLLLITTEKIYYYNVKNCDVLGALRTKPRKVPYTDEPKGEAVAWDENGKGYYTLGEGAHQPIVYYEEGKAY